MGAAGPPHRLGRRAGLRPRHGLPAGRGSGGGGARAAGLPRLLARAPSHRRNRPPTLAPVLPKRRRRLYIASRGGRPGALPPRRVPARSRSLRPISSFVGAVAAALPRSGGEVAVARPRRGSSPPGGALQSAALLRAARRRPRRRLLARRPRIAAGSRPARGGRAGLQGSGRAAVPSRREGAPTPRLCLPTGAAGAPSPRPRQECRTERGGDGRAARGGLRSAGPAPGKAVPRSVEPGRHPREGRLQPSPGQLGSAAGRGVPAGAHGSESSRRSRPTRQPERGSRLGGPRRSPRLGAPSSAPGPPSASGRRARGSAVQAPPAASFCDLRPDVLRGWGCCDGPLPQPGWKEGRPTKEGGGGSLQGSPAGLTLRMQGGLAGEPGGSLPLDGKRSSKR